MMESSQNAAALAARAYYDSRDADNFYSRVWGGEDIHIGVYQSDNESIADASRSSVCQMAARSTRLPVGRDLQVLDIGAGFGGPARFLTANYDCSVVTLNLSHVQNRRIREVNTRAASPRQVLVVEGAFEDIPCAAASFDIVWSQDSLLHSGNRERVFAEVARVSKKGGDFIFTDPMQADGCPPGSLQPILDRLELESLASRAFYSAVAEKLGWVDLGFEDYTPHLVTHYERVLEETVRREAELRGVISGEFIDRTKTGLAHWIEGGQRGHLVWGIFHFRV